MPNYTEFTALFDYYRVRGVHIKVVYTNNVANTSAVVGAAAQAIALPTLQCMFDYDDNTPPSTENELLQRPGVKLLTLGTNGPLDLFVKPKIAAYAATDTATQPAILGSTDSWLDANYPNVFHYGYKMWSTAWSAVPLQSGYFQFFFTYDLEFKGMR